MEFWNRGLDYVWGIMEGGKMSDVDAKVLGKALNKVYSRSDVLPEGGRFGTIGKAEN